MIKRIDADTIEITTTQIVKISELKKELVDIKASNIVNKDIQDWCDTVPDRFKDNITLLPLMDTKEFEDKIKYYEGLKWQ